MSTQPSLPLLMWADTVRSADLFHAVPIAISDPFLYAELDSRKVAVVNVLERDRILDLGNGIEVIDPVEFGQDELLASKRSRLAVAQELALRSCEELELQKAAVPPDFPLAIADHLRAGGVELIVDRDLFVERRRVKTVSQIAGIRRAQKAADEAMATAARLVHQLQSGLTSEMVRSAMQDVCAEHGAYLGDDAIVAHGPQSALGHEGGSGVIERGEPVLIDIWPRDKESSCYADMTRTFVAGGGAAPEKLAEFWRLTRESIDAVMPSVRAGAECKDLYEKACEPFERAGYPTQRSKQPGEVLDRGFYHGLGHGLGLEIHETPSLSKGSPDVLAAGDVITIEPGCYEPGFGGCRLENLILVTKDGYEVLTNFPYDL